jgi:hypothetical protein
MAFRAGANRRSIRPIRLSQFRQHGNRCQHGYFAVTSALIRERCSRSRIESPAVSETGDLFAADEMPSGDAADSSSYPVASDELLAHLRLSLVPGIGPRHLTSLLDYFGDPDAVLAASIADLEHVSGIGPKLAMQIQTAKHSNAAEREWRLACEHGFRFLDCCDAGEKFSSRTTWRSRSSAHDAARFTASNRPSGSGGHLRWPG